MIEVIPEVKISTVYGGYIVALYIGDEYAVHTCGSLKQVFKLAQEHLESLEETAEDEPVMVEEE